MSRAKKQRNRFILQYQKDNPDCTLAEIAEVFNLSKQRVWEIINDYHKPQRKPEPAGAVANPPPAAPDKVSA